jgi:hypothetical protein
MTQYTKFLLAAVVAIVSAAAGSLASANGHFTQATVANTVLAVLGAIAVYAAPNVPGAPGWLGGAYTKLLLAALTAAATAVSSFLMAGGNLTAITPAEVIQIVLAVVGAIGVGMAPNVAPPPMPARAAR